MVRKISQPYRLVRDWIDRTAMYLIVLYMLSILALTAVVAGVFGLVAPTVGAQLLGLTVVLITGYGTSVLCAWLRGVTAHHHSSIITALILFFLLMPEVTLESNLILAGTVAVAIVSKYLFTIRRQHIVNPATLAVVLLGLSGFSYAAWWAASPWLVVPLLLTGAVVVSKIRKWVPVAAFIFTGLLVYIVEGWWYVGIDPVSSVSQFIFYAPALFLGFFMLTEPLTMPPTKRLQLGYAVLVGFLANTALLHPFVPMTAELALLVGNVAFYPTTLRRKLFLTLESKREIAAHTWEFVFTKPAQMAFKAGQYLEWMLPHDADMRGIRRYFTIAASPTEDSIRLALKIMNPGSSYKAALLALPIGGTVVASQRAGDFTLPTDGTKKLAMVAGGIGVTPFRSQVQYLLDTKRATDITLFYCSNTKADMAYCELWTAAAAQLPFTLVPIFAKEPASNDYETGFLTAEILKRHTPDFLDRTWYVSGPPPMVNATVTMLRTLGVSKRKIVQDFFPGLA